MFGRFSGPLVASALVLMWAASVTAAPSDSSGDPKVQARAAYAKGEAAAKAGNLREAALAFERADELLPSPAALESALGAAVRSDDPVLVMTLVDRAEATSRGGLVAVKEAKAAFASRVGTIRTPALDDRADCSLAVDESPVRTALLRVAPGEHRVKLGCGGDSIEERVVVAAGGEHLVALKTKPVVPPKPAPSPRGPSPLWLLLGGGVTAGLGAATLATGVLALERQADLDALQCKEAPSPCTIGSADAQQAVIDEGERFETLSFVFGGLTGGAAIGTVLFAALGVDWSDEPVAVVPGPTAVALRVRF